MALVFKRILMITHNVQFAIDTKRALESLGDYEVTTVTDARHAIDVLKDQSHNLAMIDVENLAIPTLDMIKAIRSTQNDIAIILAPDLPDVRDTAEILDVQGVVDIPAPVRSLIPIIEQSVREIFDKLPDTVKAPAVDALQETVYIETLVDELLGDDETPYFTNRQIPAQKRQPLDQLDEDETQHSNTVEVVIESDGDEERIRYVDRTDEYGEQSLRLFQQLAAEEPPMPDLEQNGTISDLVRNVTQSHQIPSLEETDDETEHSDNAIDEEVSDSVATILVLETVSNETTPIEAISLQTLYDNIQNRLPKDKQGIRPLPSWVKESEKFVREPIFVRDELDYLEAQQPMEYTSTNTQASDGTFVVSDASDMETEVIESERPFSTDDLVSEVDIGDVEESVPTDDEIKTSEPVTESKSVEEEVQSAVEDETAFDEFDQPADITDTDAVVDDVVPVEDADDVKAVQSEDSFVAQLSVTLTQVTTELTAEATILTRENAIVAYSGDMPMEDIEDVREVIKDDWTAGIDNARIRFITLPGSGKDYMLYSKGTVAGYSLSMVFAGTRQLRIIRRQGERLINALEAVPETMPVVEDELIEVIEEPVQQEVTSEADVEDTPDDSEKIDVGPKTPYTFIWLVDDFNITFSEQVAKQLLFWLETQLNGLYWTIHTLTVHQDFIYLYADVPGDLSPATLIRNLMTRSQKIVRSEDETLPEDLWADAYLVLTPGREMTDREIQRFLNFARNEI